jgi:hypothetical protein
MSNLLAKRVESKETEQGRVYRITPMVGEAIEVSCDAFPKGDILLARGVSLGGTLLKIYNDVHGNMCVGIDPNWGEPVGREERNVGKVSN